MDASEIATLVSKLVRESLDEYKRDEENTSCKNEACIERILTLEAKVKELRGTIVMMSKKATSWAAKHANVRVINTNLQDRVCAYERKIKAIQDKLGSNMRVLCACDIVSSNNCAVYSR